MAAHEPVDYQWLIEARASYVRSAPDKIHDLRTVISALEMNPSSQPHERRLRRMLHQLIGSGGSYGFPTVSEIAREMSDCLHARLDASLPVDDTTIVALKHHVENLSRVFEDDSDSTELPI